MTEDEIYDLTSRDVTEQSISESFKGIIRLAHIKELTPGVSDTFLSTEYYGIPDKLMDLSGASSERGIGYPSATPALFGSIERYNSSDEYKDKKLPVTTSLGEYLNYSLGIDGVTFGHFYENSSPNIAKITTTNNKGVQSEHPKFFPSLTSDYLHIGISDSTNFNDGELLIENHPQNSARMVIENPTNQCSSDGYSYEKEGIGVKTPSGTKNLDYRTVFTSQKTLGDNNVIMYRQENYDRDNLTLGTLDANVSIVNFVDYVKEKLEVLLNSDFVSVPTGSVMWQYVSLDKYYGGSYGSSVDKATKDEMPYPGHQPPLGPITDTTYDEQRIQGACKDINIISSNTKEKSPEEEGKDTDEEAIAIYRRDYVLCDGTVYHITLNPVNTDIESNRAALERFFDLFYVIGYEYTNPEDMTPHGHYYIHTNEKGEKYRMSFNEQDEAVADEDFQKTTDLYKFPEFHEDTNIKRMKDVAYSIDVATILAYNLLQQAKDSSDVCVDGIFNREKAENFLKNQKIDKRYPIVTPLPSASNTTSLPTSTNVDTNDTSDNNWLLDNGYPLPYKKTILKDNELTKLFTSASNYKSYCGGKKYEGMYSGDIYEGIELGREIQTFNDPILFYEKSKPRTIVNANNTVTTYYEPIYKICRVYQLPSIQRILEYLTPGMGGINDKLWSDFFTFKFAVPNFNIKITGASRVGAFIAFSHYHSKNGTITTTGNNPTLMDVPHRHSVFRGPLSYTLGDWSGSTDSGITTNKNKYPSSAICWKQPTLTAWHGGHERSYAIFEVRANFDQAEPVTGAMHGVSSETDYYENYAYRFRMYGGNSTPRIDANRCPTSEPLVNGTGFTHNMSQKYDLGLSNMTSAGLYEYAFTPESAVMVPIIKL